MTTMRALLVFDRVAHDLEELAGRQFARVHRLDDHVAGFDLLVHVQSRARASACAARARFPRTGTPPSTRRAWPPPSRSASPATICRCRPRPSSSVLVPRSMPPPSSASSAGRPLCRVPLAMLAAMVRRDQAREHVHAAGLDLVVVEAAVERDARASWSRAGDGGRRRIPAATGPAISTPCTIVCALRPCSACWFSSSSSTVPLRPAKYCLSARIWRRKRSSDPGEQADLRQRIEHHALRLQPLDLGQDAPGSPRPVRPRRGGTSCTALPDRAGRPSGTARGCARLRATSRATPRLRAAPPRFPTASRTARSRRASRLPAGTAAPSWSCPRRAALRRGRGGWA